MHFNWLEEFCIIFTFIYLLSSWQLTTATILKMSMRKQTQRSQWQWKLWATRQCCDYRSAEAKCCDCYILCIASLGTESVSTYIFGEMNALAETFCKITDLTVETCIVVLQVYRHYFMFLSLTCNLNKGFWTTFTTWIISLWPTLSIPSGIINTFSEMVLGQDYLCLHKHKWKKYLKGPRQLDLRHIIS